VSTASQERPQPDRLLLFTTVLLCAAGLVMVTSASVAFAYNQHQSTFYYAERQAAWLMIGFVALFVLARIDYRRIRPLAPAGAVAVALLMLLVLVPHLGVSVNGARRWFDAGPLGTFQPSELGKLAFAVFIAHWIDRNSERMGQFQQVFVPFAAMLAGVLALLMLERDLGTAIVTVGIFLSAYWAGGGRLRHIILLAAFLGLGFIAVTLLEPYRMSRLTAFKNPWADPLGAGFQATQSLYGLASGHRSLDREVRLAPGGAHRLHLRHHRRGDRFDRDDACDARLPRVRHPRLSRVAACAGQVRDGACSVDHHVGDLRGVAQHGDGHQHASDHWRAPAFFQLRGHRARHVAGRGRHPAEHRPPRLGFGVAEQSSE